jgi:hypothetical protein
MPLRYSMISCQQLRVLVAELLLLEVDQLAERHPQDGVGLHRGERVLFGNAPFGLELRVALVAEGPLEHCPRSLDLS